MSRRFTYICAVVATLVLSACGDDETPMTTVTTRATTTTSASPDQGAADALRLTTADLPTGWAATPPSANTATASVDIYRQFASCLGTPDAQDQQSATASGETLSNGQLLVASQGTVYKTSQTVSTQLSGLQSGSANECLAGTVDDLLARSLTAATSAQHTTRIQAVEGLRLTGNEFALAAVINISTSSIQQTVRITFLGLGSDNKLAFAAVVSPTSAPPNELVRQMLDALQRKSA